MLTKRKTNAASLIAIEILEQEAAQPKDHQVPLVQEFAQQLQLLHQGTTIVPNALKLTSANLTRIAQPLRDAVKTDVVPSSAEMPFTKILHKLFICKF